MSEREVVVKYCLENRVNLYYQYHKIGDMALVHVFKCLISS